jgi:hypothetical protein
VSEAELEGERIRATLAAPGSDWMWFSDDGFWRPDVRAPFETWKGSVALRDATKDVAKLKQEDGPTLVTQGSTELVHALLAADLVDEIRTFTFRVVLGKGKRLFDESSQPRAFTVTHSAVSPNGLIAATYVRDGEVKTATVGGAQEPSSAELARREKLKREG